MTLSGEKIKWDCGKCQWHKLDRERNCGGHFPDSRFSKTGYEISNFKIYECPKTYIKTWALDFIRFIDSASSSRIPMYTSMDSVPAKLMALWEIAEIEKAQVRISFQQNETKEVR